MKIVVAYRNRENVILYVSRNIKERETDDFKMAYAYETEKKALIARGCWRAKGRWTCQAVWATSAADVDLSIPLPTREAFAS